ANLCTSSLFVKCLLASLLPSRKEHWKLLSSLKTTVEGLLSTNNPNVWSRYGGLQRLHKDMNNILSHGLRNEQVYYKQRNYWPFVWCVRYISPQLASHVEQFRHLEPVLSTGMKSAGESYKAERWLLHSLQVHMLSSQLRPLLKHLGHMRKYYNDDAFLLSEPHVTAMFQCLEAVEQNNPKLLAQVDTVGVVQILICPICLADTTSQTSSLESEWVVVTSPGENARGATPPPGSASIPSISLTDTNSFLQPEADEYGGGGDSDDGPEYLAIGNLGQRNDRCNSQSSTHSSERGGNTDQSLQRSTTQAPQRRSSFSEGQKGPGRGLKGHTRSFSDTGVNQKLRNGDAVCKCLFLWLCVSVYALFTSDGSQSSSTSEGMFRRPSEGQSLISYLSEQDFGSCADLEKENAHFSISESLIAAIELMKYNMRRQEEGEEEGDSDNEIQQLKQKIRLRRQQIRRSRLPPSANSQHAFHSTDSGGSRRSSQDSYQGLSDSGSAEEVEEFVDFTVPFLKMSCFPVCSTPSFLQSNSAESVAMGLLRQFEGMQLPAASELDWLVPEQDAPQKLLPIPDSLPISPDDGEHADIYKLRIRVRGNLEWAPPRPQIIFNIHPAPKRKIIVAKQNYRCAGCGTRIDPDYIKRLRYCEYIGRYFCQCCHENSQAVVPGRVLRKWDFSKYYVSNFARDLLSKISGDPLFNLNDINSELYKKNKSLETVRVLRMQLFHMKNLFKTCRLAKDLLDKFDSLPGHLTEDFHLFSLNDLTAVRNGELGSRMKELLKLGTMHVAGCVLCQAKGFICEFCGNDKDIIFPFHLSKCQRCEDCHACYHRTCFRTGKDCPRCQRLADRRERMARKNMEEQEDEGGGP
uniref:RUN domain-containing protein n=1 Tax=Astatotilapia calliptera TaxID=8154 RepID=A0AAX7VV43_ASTCA